MLKIVNNFPKKRGWPKQGDVFTYLATDGKYRYGLVVNDKVNFGMVENHLLIYFYSVSSESVFEKKELSELKIQNLLFPPVITNNGGWAKGFFETIFKIKDGFDVFNEHYFLRSTDDKIFNEHFEVVTDLKPETPIGSSSILLINGLVKLIEKSICDLKQVRQV